ALVGAWVPEIGDQKDAMDALKCRLERVGPVQIPFDDLVGEAAMLVRIATQRAHPELAARLQGTHAAAALLSRGADHGDQWLIAGCRAHETTLLCWFDIAVCGSCI